VKKASVGISLSHEIFDPNALQKKVLFAPPSMKNL
jgi:hypothetical protein